MGRVEGLRGLGRLGFRVLRGLGIEGLGCLTGFLLGDGFCLSCHDGDLL